VLAALFLARRGLLDWVAVPRCFRFFVSLASVAGALSLSVASIGCNSLVTSPTVAVPTTSQFNTTLIAPGGSSISTFTLTTTMTVGVTLVSVISNVDGSVLLPTMSLSLGTLTNATTCSPLLAPRAVMPALAAQIQQSEPAGTYCVVVQDAGLGEPGVTTVRINMSSTAPTNIPTPESIDVFSSTVGPQGSAVHQVPILYNGMTSLTLVSAGASATIGMGFGAWDGQVCRLNSTVVAQANANPLIAATVDPGNYCIRVYDVGQLTSPILFTIDTIHP
jgi:hypothetical protein